MGRGRFFPFPFHGTKETTRTHAPALRAAADGVGALCALRGSRRRIRKFARRDFFFSSPRAGGDSSRPPSSHKKRSVLPNASLFFFASFERRGDSASRPLYRVFSESITRTSSSFGPSFGSRRRRKKSTTPRFVRLASGCLIPSVRLLILRETQNFLCLLFFYERSSSPRPAAQPGSDRK